MWKTRPERRTKPVIARDTTYSVYPLTGTTCGSNFAIPSNKIPPHGNGTEFPAVLEEPCGPVPARGDSAPLRRERKGSGAWASRSVSPAPETFNLTSVLLLGSPNPEAGRRSEVRWPFPDPPPGCDITKAASLQLSVTCPSADEGNSFFWRGSRTQEPDTWKV